MYLNKVVIVGNITRNPELKATPSGAKVCTLGVATNRTWKDSNGAKQEEVEYHNVVIWGKTAENVAQYMKKGSSILIEGRLATRSWEKEGVKQYRTEIIAESVQFGATKVSQGESHEKVVVDTSNEPCIDPQTGMDLNPNTSADDIPF